MLVLHSNRCKYNRDVVIAVMGCGCMINGGMHVNSQHTYVLLRAHKQINMWACLLVVHSMISPNFSSYLLRPDIISSSSPVNAALYKCLTAGESAPLLTSV